MKFLRQPRQPCIGLALCAAVAIFCADHWRANFAWLAAALVVGAFGALWKPRAPFIWLCVFAAFFWRHQIARDSDGRRLAEEMGGASHPVSGTAIVVTEPREGESFRGVPRSHFTVRLETLTLDSPRKISALAWLLWTGDPPRYGDRVSFTGDIENIPPARNPGQFDYAGVLHRRGLFSEIHLRYANDGTVLAHDCGHPVIAFSQRARTWMQTALTRDLAPEIGGLVQSIVLGLKDETPDETREMFQRTGTLHLFVVNGLHVGMFGLIAWFLLKPFRVTRRTAFFFIVPLIAFYALVTGLNPGSIRAAVMGAILLGGALAERPPLPFNSLAAAALAMLLWDTNELFLPGFQFSFGVVFTILFLARHIREKLVPLVHPDPFLPRPLWGKVQIVRTVLWQRFAQIFAVTTSASIGSTPFTAHYFHLLAPSSLVANLLVVPLALALLFEGVLAMLAGLVKTSVSLLFNNVNWLLAHGVLLLVSFFAAIPGGHLFVELPRERTACEILVFDLGGGGAAHVRSAGKDWLLDCGNVFFYENAVRPWLRSRGVNRLDGFAITHGDVAHVGAATRVLADFCPARILDSASRDRSQNRRAFHAELAANRLGKSICEPGDVLPISSEAIVQVLYPPPGSEAGAADDKALVLRLETLGVRILWMSDSGFVTERWLLDHEPDLRSDILIKGQHSADISGTSEFLNKVHPRVLICSGASFPASEKVNEEWAADVVARGIALFREDKTGAVEIAIKPAEWNVRAFLGGQTFTSRSE